MFQIIFPSSHIQGLLPCFIKITQNIAFNIQATLVFGTTAHSQLLANTQFNSAGQCVHYHFIKLEMHLNGEIPV